MKDNSGKIYMAAISHSLITGLSFAFTKIALEYTSPMNILGHRFIFALVALVVTLLIKKKMSYFSWENFKKILPLALVYPLLFFGFQTFGLRGINSSLGGILLSTAPIFTLILARIFLKEVPSKKQIVFVLSAVFGVVFIFYNSLGATGLGDGSVMGIVLLLVTTICFSTYNIMAKKYTAKYENLELLTVMISVGFLGFNLLAVFLNIKAGSLGAYFQPLTNINYIFAIIYLGVLSTLGTSLLTNYILRYLSPSKVSVFANLSTLISIIGGVLILNEELFYYHIIGAIFIITGVVGANFAKEKVK